VFHDHVDELAHRIDPFDLGKRELEIELALDAADEADMGEATPAFQVRLAGRKADLQIVVELGAENIL
jgi:hypothetical protein